MNETLQIRKDGTLKVHSHPEPVVRLEGGNIVLRAGERLGAFLLRAREGKGRTRDWVCSKMKNPPITQETLASIEHGYLKEIPSDILKEIANVLSLDAKELRKLQKKDVKDPVTYNYY